MREMRATQDKEVGADNDTVGIAGDAIKAYPALFPGVSIDPRNRRVPSPCKAAFAGRMTFVASEEIPKLQLQLV